MQLSEETNAINILKPVKQIQCINNRVFQHPHDIMIVLYSNNVLAKYTLMYAYDTYPSKIHTIEYLYDESIPFFDIYLTKQERKDIKIIVPGEGEYHLPYHSEVIQLKVENVFLPSDAVLQNRESSEIIKRITISIMRDASDKEVLLRFIQEAKAHVEYRLNEFKDQQNNTITKYVFDTKYQEWNVLNVCNKRHWQSLFIEPNVKSKLLSVIEDFIDLNTMREYINCCIPYKCNLLLYGKHGTGKTSTIHAIASHINADMFILNFSRDIDDAMLTQAFNNTTLSNYDKKKNKHKIIVMEDIDCMFANRKEHDTSRNNVSFSGLLNVLDGLMRADGTIAFLTANNIDMIDKALLRPCRMDLILRFKDVKKDQIRDMFGYFLPYQTHLFDTFYKHIEYKQVTGSALQQFLFSHRKCTSILDHIQELHEILTSNETGRAGREGDSNVDNAHIYM
jgi:hypothetical protein